MEFIFYVLLITFVISLLIVIIGRATNPNKNTNNNIRLTPEQDKWIKTVKDLFNQNEAVSFLDIYVKCGMDKDIAYSKNSDLIKQNIPFDEDDNENNPYNIFRAYQWAVSNRLSYKKWELIPINAERYGLNLQNNETIYHRINSVTLYQEKTTRYNVAYTGVRWQSGLLRAGTITAIGNEIKSFTPIDIGRLFITNQRVLFVGRQNNVTKSTPIKSVLYYNLYQDGVLLNTPNRKPVLFKFETGYDAEISHVHDGLNEFTIILDRIISGTEDKSLTEQ